MAAENTPGQGRERLTNPERPFEGQVWVLTGAGRKNGLQAEVAKQAGLKGAKIVTSSTSASISEALSFVGELEAQGIEANWVQADLTDDLEARGLVQSAIGLHGKIDHLVLGAGKRFDGLFGDIDDETWEQAFQVNLLGAVRVVRAALPHMQRGAKITFFSSVAKEGNAGQTPYASMKAATEALAKSLAQEMRRNRITVNVVAPGLVEGTEMTKDVDEKMKARILALTGTQESVTRERVAEAVLAAALPKADGSFHNGETFVVV